MLRTRDLAIIGIFTAILIGAQLVLAAIAGVEIVTILLLSFCFAFGIKRSVYLVNLFSLLRCLIFGFFPTVVILYLVYYNIFALLIGGLGNKFKHTDSKKSFFVMLAVGVLLTVLFTLLDGVITPAFFGFTFEAAKAYFIASFATLIPQILSAAISIALLFFPLNKVCLKFNGK